MALTETREWWTRVVGMTRACADRHARQVRTEIVRPWRDTRVRLREQPRAPIAALTLPLTVVPLVGRPQCRAEHAQLNLVGLTGQARRPSMHLLEVGGVPAG